MHAAKYSAAVRRLHVQFDFTQIDAGVPMLKRTVALLGLMVAVWAGPAIAGQYEDGLAAHHRRDFSTALQLWRPLADRGHAAAQNSLGGMYALGDGVPQNDVEAVRWYRKAADQGFANAQNNIGTMYDTGLGVPLDYVEAARWYRKAADQGFAGAQNNLGAMYVYGRGVPRNYIEAYKWFSLAAARFPASDTESHENTARNRDRAAAQMTPAQIAEARRLAAEWKPTPAKPQE